jgi:hypothetical protein
MKSYLLSILLICAALLTFSHPAAAQSKDKFVRKSEKTPAVSSQKKAEKKSPAGYSGELDEAVSFLNKTIGGISGLKVYKLADTERSDIAPQIADIIIRSGKDVEKIQKLAERVLQYHKLTDICSIVLFKDESPRVFTYRLRSISFSTGIFDILTDDEATALIAHETGHLYFGKDLEKAREMGDNRLARIVELKCDVISLITLRNLKIDPAVLISALKKLINAREKSGLQTITEQSPSLEDRISLTEVFLKRK